MTSLRSQYKIHRIAQAYLTSRRRHRQPELLRAINLSHKRRYGSIHPDGNILKSQWSATSIIFVAGSMILIAGAGWLVQKGQDEKSLQYQYPASLSGDSIRLLYLKPCTAGREEQIQCTLGTVKMTAAPEYCALSYTWGSPEYDYDEPYRSNISLPPPDENAQILVNGHNFLVTSNLHDALTQLRSNQEEKSFPLWVDAVCINQSDLHEKSLQVNMMGDIYRRATSIMVWLGRDERHDGPLIHSMIHRIAAASMRFRDDMKPLNSYPVFLHSGDLDNLDLLNAYDLPIWSDSVWLRLALFFNRRWFRRGWCAQEVMLAKDSMDVCFMYGSMMIPWDTVAITSRLLVTSGLTAALGNLVSYHYGRSDGSVGSEAFALRRLQDLQHVDSNFRWANLLEERPHLFTRPDNAYSILLYLLESLPHRAVSDPRDKLYALLGILDNVCKETGIQRISLRADYVKDESTVLTEVAKGLIEETGSLRFLTHGRSWYPGSRLPSWALGFIYDYPMASLFKTNLYNASKTRDLSEASHYFTGDTLNLLALEIAVLEQTSPSGTDFRTDCLGHFEFLRDFSKVLRDDDKTPLVTLMDVLTAGDMSQTRSTAITTHLANFKTWLQSVLVEQALFDTVFEQDPDHFRHLMQTLDEISQSDHSGTMFTSKEIYQLIDECGIKEGARMDDAVRITQRLSLTGLFDKPPDNMLFHRRLFRTDQGHMGACPEAAQPGDRVFLVHGSPVPFILRRVPTATAETGKDRYYILGEAYVDGIMNGEAVANRETRWSMIEVV